VSTNRFVLGHTAGSLLALQLTGSKQLFPQLTGSKQLFPQLTGSKQLFPRAFYFILLTAWHDFVLRHRHPDVGDNFCTVMGLNSITLQSVCFQFYRQIQRHRSSYFACFGLCTSKCLMTIIVVICFMVQTCSGVHPAFLPMAPAFVPRGKVTGTWS